MSIAQSFNRSGFARFINTPAGRVVRIIVGIILIVWGYTIADTGLGIVLMIIGLFPLVAGVFDLCLASALLGGPVKGETLRSSKK